MYQKFCKFELSRKFDGESFKSSENPSFLKLYVGYSGTGRVYIHATVKEVVCICML
jgi:hypothetical protein